MDEVLTYISAGGDVGTLGVLFVYVKHSNMLAGLKAKIETLERALL